MAGTEIGKHRGSRTSWVAHTRRLLLEGLARRGSRPALETDVDEVADLLRLEA